MKKRLRSFFSKAGASTGLPSDGVVPVSDASLHGRKECVFLGVKRILSYTDSLISLLLCDASVRVEGEDLRLVVFDGCGAEIKGKICSVIYGERGKNR